MEKLTKKYVIQNTSISKVYATNGSTLEGCRFEMSQNLAYNTYVNEELENKLFANMLKWGWIKNTGCYTITWEGLRNLRMI